jgi:hypothetical protein
LLRAKERRPYCRLFSGKRAREIKQRTCSTHLWQTDFFCDRELLRNEVADTLSDPAMVDEELVVLLGAFR